MDKFKTWKEFRKELNITPEQEEEIRIENEIIQATIEARKKKQITQAEISKKSGLTQSVVARIESGTHSPTMQTMIKYLYAIGYTLQVVPAKDKKIIRNSINHKLVSKTASHKINNNIQYELNNPGKK